MPEGGGINFTQYNSGFTASLYHEADTTKLGYLAFDPVELYKIKWRPKVGPCSESSRSQRGRPSSESRKKPTGSSTTPTP